MEPRADPGAPRGFGPPRAAFPIGPHSGDERQGLDVRARGRRTAGPAGGAQGRRVHVAAPGVGARAHRGRRRADWRRGVRRVDHVPPTAHRAARREFLRGHDRNRVRGPRGARGGHRGDRSGAGGPARFDERHHAARVRRHEDCQGTHRLSGHGALVHRAREGGHRQARSSLRHRRAGSRRSPGPARRGREPRSAPRDRRRRYSGADQATGPQGTPSARQRVGRARGAEHAAAAVRAGGRCMAGELRAGLCARTVRRPGRRSLGVRRGAQSRRRARPPPCASATHPTRAARS